MAQGSMGGGPGRQLSKAGAMASRDAPRVAASRRTRPSAPSPGRAWALLRRRRPGSRWVGLPGRRFAASGQSRLLLPVAVILELFFSSPEAVEGGRTEVSRTQRAGAGPWGRGDATVRPCPASYGSWAQSGLSSATVFRYRVRPTSSHAFTPLRHCSVLTIDS